jgi:hypothetical protein
MKKTFITFLLAISSVAFSQEKKSELATTTLEEYNYLTKGYAEGLEKGFSVKEGYELKKWTDMEIEDFSFTYYFFNELSTKKTKAMLIVAKKLKSGKEKTVYMCLPFGSKDLLVRSFNEKVGGMSFGYIYQTLNYNLLSTAMNKIKNDPCSELNN